MNKIFLGGTCNGTTWRDQLVRMLDYSIKYFNPVVEDWTPACQEIEWKEKNEHCSVHFYCITSQMKGVFSIAEVVDSVHTKGKRTILHVLPDGFDSAQLKSLQAVVDLVNARGGIAYVDSDLARSARLLNNSFGTFDSMMYQAVNKA